MSEVMSLDKLGDILERTDVATSTRATQKSVDDIQIALDSQGDTIVGIEDAIAPDSIDIINGASVFKTVNAKINSTYTAADVTDINSSSISWKTPLDITGDIIISKLSFSMQSNYNYRYYNAFYRLTLGNHVYTGFLKSYQWSGSSSGINTAILKFNFSGFQSNPVKSSSGAFPSTLQLVADRGNAGEKSYNYYSDRGLLVDRLKLEMAIGYSSLNSTDAQASVGASYKLL